MSKVDNAVIMAAGTSARFAPLSYEKPKALIEIRGEPLIERQIKQLREAGVDEIYVVTGYKAEKFSYLKEKCGVKLIHNTEYLTRNNNGSVWAAKDVIRNTYICSGDNYFTINPFEPEVDGAYYSALYAHGATNEWCIEEGPDGYIRSVKIGGENVWYMLGHVFWNEEFSSHFLSILEKEYFLPETKDKLWEAIYIDHIRELPMRIRKYPDEAIFEFDTLDELRAFDPSYIDDTRSKILKAVASGLNVKESKLQNIAAIKGQDNLAVGFTFICNGKKFIYKYNDKKIQEVSKDEY